MDDDHYRNAIRYVERNPVRAGMVQRPEEYPWSSAAAHCVLRDDPLLFLECPIVRGIVNWQEWLEFENPEEVNAHIRKQTLTGRVLGSKEFVLQLERDTGRTLSPKKRGPSSKTTGSETLPGDAEIMLPPTLFGSLDV